MTRKTTMVCSHLETDILEYKVKWAFDFIHH